MNDDASTFDLPEYIHSRLQPQILIDFPERDEEYQILKENLPFGEDRILQYVTDFLQQAHAADERYTVRDGINIARFAMKLKSLATDRRARDAQALALSDPRDPRGRGAALCPQNLSAAGMRNSFTNRAVLSAAASPIFPLRRDGGVRRRSAPGASWRAPAGRRRRAAADSRRGLPDAPSHACRRSPSSFIRTTKDEEARPFMSRRTGRSVYRSRAHCARNRRRDAVCRRGSWRAPARSGPASGSLLASAHRARPFCRGVSGLSAATVGDIAAHAAGIAWKLQGTNPLEPGLGGASRSTCSTPCSTPWKSHRTNPRRSRRRDAGIMNPHPDCLAEITTEYPYLQHLYEELPRQMMNQAGAIDRRRAQLALFRDAETALRVNTGETVDALAAPPHSPLYPQSRPVLRRPYGRAVRPHRGRALHCGRQLRLGSVADRRALSGAEARCDSRPLKSPARRSGATRRKSGCAAACPPETALKSRRPETPQERKVPGRVGAGVQRRCDLLLPAGRSRYRRLRTILQEESQKHSFRGTLAHGAVHHLNARRRGPARATH